jgi:ankyrin repeat protein
MPGGVARAAGLLAVPAIVALAVGLGVSVGGAENDDVVDVNARKPDGSTPLHYAVYEGDAAKVRRLLALGADARAANRYGSTPLGLAAEAADTEILEMLLEAGADPDSPNADGMTALMLVARTGNVDAAELLIARGAAIDARESFGGQTAHMWAAARRHPEMLTLLLEHGADVDARSAWRDYQRHIQAEGRPKSLDTGGFTPLLYAARENCRACVRVLLEHGADINLPDPDGVSPLHLAIMNANWDLAKDLIEAGADVNQWDIYGEAPLFTAVGQRTRHDGGRASIDPPNETDGLTIVKMLLERGADPNMQLYFRPANVRGSTNTRGSTPLVRAAANNDIEVVKLLLEHGADATVYMADRQTPIHAALAGRANEKDAIEMIKLFHEAGTDVNVVALVVHMEEVRGGSALHYAVRKRYKDVIRLLASYGIDMNLKDQDGLTALDYTQSRGFMPFMALQTPIYEEEAKLLRELGATELMAQAPDWPVLGPPQGLWLDIYPLGEPVVHPPVYTHKRASH